MILLAHALDAVPAPPPAPQATVACVIVNHGSHDLVVRCVASLRATAPQVGIWVVDNSEPGEASALRASLPTCTVLVVPNRGFGAACNAAIEAVLATRADLTHVLLLNPDTEVEPGCLDAMLATWARQPDAGIVGARVLSMDGTRVLFECGRVRPCTLTRSHVPAPAGNPDIETGFVTGACMLIGADLLRSGLRFDEGYFLYVEDMDLCRAVVARGRSLWVARGARVRHHDGGTQREPAVLGTMRARQLTWLTAGKVRFARKWLTPWQRVCFFAMAAIAKPLVGLLTSGSTAFVRPYFAGLFQRADRRVPQASSPYASRRCLPRVCSPSASRSPADSPPNAVSTSSSTATATRSTTGR